MNEWQRVSDQILELPSSHRIFNVPCKNAGSFFYNYKRSHSLVLMAQCVMHIIVSLWTLEIVANRGVPAIANSIFGQALDVECLVCLLIPLSPEQREPTFTVCFVVMKLSL